MTPINSVRRASQEVNLSKSVVYRTMRKILKYRPSKIHLTQKSYDEDQKLHVEMRERLIPILEDENNDGSTFFSDKANFHVLGMVNKHNCRMWSDKNPFFYERDGK